MVYQSSVSPIFVVVKNIYDPQNITQFSKKTSTNVKPRSGIFKLLEPRSEKIREIFCY